MSGIQSNSWDASKAVAVAFSLKSPKECLTISHFYFAGFFIFIFWLCFVLASAFLLLLLLICWILIPHVTVSFCTHLSRFTQWTMWVWLPKYGQNIWPRKKKRDIKVISSLLPAPPHPISSLEHTFISSVKLGGQCGGVMPSEFPPYESLPRLTHSWRLFPVVGISCN